MSKRTAQAFRAIAVSTGVNEEDYPLVIEILERHPALFSRSNDDELKNLILQTRHDHQATRSGELSDAIDRTIIIHQGEFLPASQSSSLDNAHFR